MEKWVDDYAKCNSDFLITERSLDEVYWGHFSVKVHACVPSFGSDPFGLFDSPCVGCFLCGLFYSLYGYFT